MTRLRIVRESPAAIEARALETIDRNLRNIARHGPKLNDRGWYVCSYAVFSALRDLEHIGRRDAGMDLVRAAREGQR